VPRNVAAARGVVVSEAPRASPPGHRPLERVVGDPFPAVLADGVMAAVGVLLVLGHRRRLLLQLEVRAGDRGRHRVVLAAADQEQRRAIGLVVDHGDGVRVEVRERGLEQRPAGAGDAVAVIDGPRLALAEHVAERVVELLGRQHLRRLAVAGAAERDRRDTPLRRRQDHHALGRRRVDRDAGRAEPAVEQDLGHEAAERVAHDDRGPLELADDALVVVGDLLHAEPFERLRVTPDLLLGPVEARPRGGEDGVARVAEARVPVLPAQRGHPQPVDEDDRLRHM
jgi:hypothetical protein